MPVCTLTGTILDAQGAPLNGATITFTPVTVPITGSGSVIAFSMPTVTTSPAGAFSIALENNAYNVQITAAATNYQTQFAITIPPGTTSGTIDQFTGASVSAAGASTAYYGSNTRLTPGTGLQLFNPATGLWHTLLVSGNPAQLGFDAGIPN